MKKDLSGRDRLSKFDKRSPAGYPSDKEIPVVLVLKRKAIRVYPDNQKIALYYSQALDKYVSVPFGPGSDLGPQLNESNGDIKKTRRRPRKEEDPEDRPDILDRIKHLSPEVQNLVKARLGQKVKTKGGYKYPVSELDVIARTPASDPGLKNVKYGYAKKALTDIASAGKGEISPAETAFRLVGLGARAATNMIRKKVGALRKPSTPTKVEESFKDKVSNLRESYGLDEDWRMKAAEIIAKKAAGKAAGGASKMKKPQPKMSAKSVRRKRPLPNARRGSSLSDLIAAGGGKEDQKGGDQSQEVSAFDAAKAAAVLATKTPQQQFGNIGTPTTNISIEKPQGELMNLVAFNQQKRMLMPESYDSNLEAIRHIVENNIKYHELQFGDRTVSLNNSVAKKVINLYESLNKQNKKKIEKMLNEDVSSFRKVINFAIRQ